MNVGYPNQFVRPPRSVLSTDSYPVLPVHSPWLVSRARGRPLALRVSLPLPLPPWAQARLHARSCPRKTQRCASCAEKLTCMSFTSASA
eukprot:6193506-Pleurochrysis_carterae.AAC.4